MTTPVRRSEAAPHPIEPAPRLLLFDLDDTLCDYAAARDLRLRIAFTLHETGTRLDTSSRPPSPAVERMIAESLATHPHGADHFPDLFRRHGVPEAGAAERAIAWYRAHRFHGLDLFADALETIAALRVVRLPGGETLERRIGLVTNGPADTQWAKIDLLGLAEVVDFAIVSGELGVEKPDRRIFDQALRLGGARPEEAVVVGDSAEHDIAGARAAGIRAIWVNRAGHRWPCRTPAPEYEVADLSGVRALLGGVGCAPLEGRESIEGGSKEPPR